MIHFLIELLIHWTWFRQFSELYFVLNWLVMRCKLRPKLVQMCSRQHDRKCRLKSSQYTLIIPHRVIQLLSHFGSPRQGCASHKSANKKNPSEASEEPSDTIIHFYFYFFLIHRRALLSANQRQCLLNRTDVPRKCWAKLLDPEYSFVAVWQILPTRFAKQKFAQLRINQVRWLLPARFTNKHSPS